MQAKRMPGERFRGERGATLPEMLVVLGVAAAVMLLAAAYSNPWLGKEDMRGSIYTVRTYLQMTRMQAVSRNHACQFRIDSSTRTMQVVDINDPSTTSDDILLSQATLPVRVSFARPDSGFAITLPVSSGTTYQATFAGDGAVTSSVGSISILGGTRYHRIDLYAAGGSKIWNWDGATWVAGW